MTSTMVQRAQDKLRPLFSTSRGPRINNQTDSNDAISLSRPDLLRCEQLDRDRVVRPGPQNRYISDACGSKAPALFYSAGEWSGTQPGTPQSHEQMSFLKIASKYSDIFTNGTMVG